MSYGLPLILFFYYIGVLFERLSQSMLFPNKKQTNPSRYGSDLSVLAPVTGLELTFELFAIYGKLTERQS